MLFSFLSLTRNRPLRPPFCSKPSSGFLSHLEKLQTQRHPTSVTSCHTSFTLLNTLQMHSLPLSQGGAASLTPGLFSSTDCVTCSALLPDLRWALAYGSGPQGALFDILPIAPGPPSLSCPRAWQIMVEGQIRSHPLICILPMAALVTSQR